MTPSPTADPAPISRSISRAAVTFCASKRGRRERQHPAWLRPYDYDYDYDYGHGSRQVRAWAVMVPSIWSRLA